MPNNTKMRFQVGNIEDSPLQNVKTEHLPQNKVKPTIIPAALQIIKSKKRRSGSNAINASNLENSSNNTSNAFAKKGGGILNNSSIQNKQTLEGELSQIIEVFRNALMQMQEANPNFGNLRTEEFTSLRNTHNAFNNIVSRFESLTIKQLKFEKKQLNEQIKILMAFCEKNARPHFKVVNKCLLQMIALKAKIELNTLKQLSKKHAKLQKAKHNKDTQQDNYQTR